MQTVREWLAAMPPTKFDPPGRGSAGAFDVGRLDQDVPELKQARSPLPRSDLPPHEMPGSVETGQDDTPDREQLARLADMAKQLLEGCRYAGLPTEDMERGLGELLDSADADPPPQHFVETTSDQEPLDGEVIEQVLKHLDGRM